VRRGGGAAAGGDGATLFCVCGCLWRDRRAGRPRLGRLWGWRGVWTAAAMAVPLSPGALFPEGAAGAAMPLVCMRFLCAAPSKMAALVSTQQSSKHEWIACCGECETPVCACDVQSRRRKRPTLISSSKLQLVHCSLSPDAKTWLDLAA